jgi:hypothetical protein
LALDLATGASPEDKNKTECERSQTESDQVNAPRHFFSAN